MMSENWTSRKLVFVQPGAFGLRPWQPFRAAGPMQNSGSAITRYPKRCGVNDHETNALQSCGVQSDLSQR